MAECSVRQPAATGLPACFVEVAGLPYKQVQESWKPYAWRRYYDPNPNGAVGITSLLLVVKDLQAVTAEFRKMGFKELEASDSQHVSA